jgi:putative ABC transport system permease protein
MALLSRLRNLWKKDSLDRNLDDELRAHLEMRANDSVASGMSPSEARYDAQKRFGNATLMKERTRDADIFAWLESVAQDIRYALRMLVRSPGFTSVAVLTLALGIGATTAMFSILSAVWLNPLPYANPGQLVAVAEIEREHFRGAMPFSYPDFADVRTQSSSFTGMGIYDTATATLTGSGRPEQLHGAVISPDLLTILGTPPELGRNFFPESHPGSSPEGLHEVILSHHLWQGRFSSDPSIVGKTITLDDDSYIVVGVMPQGFGFPIQAVPVDYWNSIAMDMKRAGGEPAMTEERGNHSFDVIGRLRDGESTVQVDSELSTIAAALEKQYPATNTRVGFHASSLLANIIGDSRDTLFVLTAAVGFLLLLACANVANLLLARATTRKSEIAIRAALGASRGRILRQLITESVLLALASGALGVLLSAWGTGLLLRLAPTGIPRVGDAGIHFPVLVFALALSAVTGILFGLAPALEASRSGVAEALKEGGRSTVSSRRSNRIRSVLMSLQVAMALVLLVGAGLLARTLERFGEVPLGFDPSHVMTATVELPDARYNARQQSEFFREAVDRLKVLPGVQSVSAAFPMPFSGNSMRTSVEIEGRPVPMQDRPIADVSAIEPAYFATLHIPLLHGRDFTIADTMTSAQVIIVNEAFAKNQFPGEDPVGKRIRPGIAATPGPIPMREIVGVVGDARDRSLRKEPAMRVYEPYPQLSIGLLALVARTDGDARAFGGAIRDQVNSLDSGLAVTRIEPLTDYRDASMADPRLDAFVLTVFAGVDLTLAAVGLFGVMAYTVAQRTNEIGIRMSLGAQRVEIRWLILGRGLRLLVWGLVLGIAAAFGLTRLMASLLFGVSATDALTFGGVVVVLGAAALAACYVPARRASRVDPMVALRYE